MSSTFSQASGSSTSPSRKRCCALIGVSHQTAPLAAREKLALQPEQLSAFHQGLHELPGIQESLVLSTCNRLEVYCVLAAGATEKPIEQFVSSFQSFPLSEFLTYRQVLWNCDAVEHLVAVAAGVDSQMVGETEIFGQVKNAYAGAAELQTQGAVIHGVFQKAFQAAKHIRNTAPIGEGQVSLTSVAIDLATKIFGSLTKVRVLVVGTGEIGEKAVRAFSGRGAKDLTVLSRNLERAQTLAQAVGAKSGTFDDLNHALQTHDIVIGCTQTQDPIVMAESLHAITRKRRLRPLFLIDLGVPRNFEAGTADLDSVFVYDLDDLVRIADDNLASRRTAITRCREIAREKAANIWDRILSRLSVESAKDPARSLKTREQVSYRGFAVSARIRKP
jgi:glutamyl-tRNA reductase